MCFILKEGGKQMKFSYLVLYCRAIDASVTFYRDIVGLTVERRYTKDGIHTAFMVEKGKRAMFDQPMVELVSGMSEMSTEQSGKLLGFTVDSLERVGALMKRNGNRLLKGPYSPDGVCTICEYEGPDGEQVGIMEVKEQK
jgi:lactoylglutathione lyase